MKKEIFSLILLLVLFIFSSAYADETLTITTYYPSPYGSYNELRAKRMAIGDNYSNSSTYVWGSGISSVADLVVEGSVGIGTSTPRPVNGDALLDVAAPMTVNDRIYFNARNQIVGNGLIAAYTTAGDFGLRTDFGDIFLVTGGWVRPQFTLRASTGTVALYGGGLQMLGTTRDPLTDSGIWTLQDFGLVLRAANVNAVYIKKDGKVGIGTTNPLSKLSVGGDGSTNTGVYSSHISTVNNITTYGVYGFSSQPCCAGFAYGVYGRGASAGVVGSGGAYGVQGSGTIAAFYATSGGYKFSDGTIQTTKASEAWRLCISCGTSWNVETGDFILGNSQEGHSYGNSCSAPYAYRSRLRAKLCCKG